jgi:hypothetical protein
MKQVSKHILNLRRTWIGDNAHQMLTAVTNNHVESYLILRKKVLDQINEFDEELKVIPLVSNVNKINKCEWCESMTLNKVWPKIPSELR